MFRIRYLLLACTLLFLPLAASAQSPATPVEQLTLRLVEGNGYTVLATAEGEPQRDELNQVAAGVFPEAMDPVVIEFYTRTGVQDVYISFVNFVPPGQDPAAEVTATAAEMRVATFATEDGAATYVTDFAQEYPRQAEVLGTNPEIIPLEDLPDHDGAIFGYSTTEPYNDVDTGEATGEVATTRILAQQGSAVASAKVSSPDPTLNRLIATELVLAQAACIAADAPCPPTPMPVEFPNSPEVSTATVTAPAANIRAASSASAEIVATAASGEMVYVTGEGVDAEGYTWLPIVTIAGVEGWIASSLVETGE